MAPLAKLTYDAAPGMKRWFAQFFRGAIDFRVQTFHTLEMVVDLAPDQEEFLAQGVRSGRFATMDEAVREAVGLLKEREVGSGVKRAANRKSLAQLFAESPVRGVDIEFDRDPSPLRPVEF